jgi:hypothetical protein
MECAHAVLRLTALLSVPFVLGGMATLAWSGKALLDRRAFLARAGRTQGTVVGFELSGSADEPGQCAIVEFEAGGRRERFRDGACFSTSPYSEGQRVGVLYDRSRPGRAEIAALWTGAAWWALAGGSALLIALGGLGVAGPFVLARRIPRLARPVPWPCLSPACPPCVSRKRH